MLALFNKVVFAELKNLLKDYFSAKRLYKGQFYCPVCQSHPHRFYQMPDEYFDQWDKFECVHSLFTIETLNFRQYYCVRCDATDRDRLCAVYLHEAFEKLDRTQKYKFIDFAPSKLSSFIRAQSFLEYRSADINGKADDTIDLIDLHIYKTESIDAFLCSHVLEHVGDDRRAMSELFRILKPGGWGICMVPINLDIENVMENSAWTSERDRWKYYCQNDHMRMYSKHGFIERLQEAGFNVSQLGTEYFGDEVFKVSGIHPRSVLYVVSKEYQ